jgi:hypothetical protein
MPPKKRYIIPKKIIIIASVAVVAIAIPVTAGIVISRQNDAATIAAEKGEQPAFSTILPKGKTIKDLGGWSRVSPATSEPVFAYTDKIAGVTVTISEQPLPKEFEGNADAQVTELTKGGAYNEITAGTIKAYVGTSAQGPQSVVFSKNNLLILIKSRQKIDNKDWSQYIESLN